MKTKIIMAAVLVVLFLVPQESDAMFGEDIVYLLQMIQLARQSIDAVNTVHQEVTTAAAYVKNPSMLAQTLTSVALNQISNGMDRQAQKNCDASLHEAAQAVQEAAAVGGLYSTQNVSLVSLLNINVANQKMRCDQLNTRLQTQNQVALYAAQEGPSNIGPMSWIPK